MSVTPDDSDDELNVQSAEEQLMRWCLKVLLGIQVFILSALLIATIVIY